MSLYGAGNAFNRRYITAAKPQVQSRPIQRQTRSERPAQCYCFQQPQMPQQPIYVDNSTNININIGDIFKQITNLFGGEDGQGSVETTPTTPTTTTTPTTPTTTTTPTTPAEAEPTGFSIDTSLLDKRDVSYDLDNLENNPKARAQAVVGKISVTGSDKSKPEIITMTDTTNGETHTFKYQLLSASDAQAHGCSGDGPFYKLISATDGNGNNIMANHDEVYQLQYKQASGTTGAKYNLIQSKGMDGAGSSSINNYMKYYNKNNGISQ